MTNSLSPGSSILRIFSMDIWKTTAAVFLLALAGCGTPSALKRARATDWESPDFATSQRTAPATIQPSATVQSTAVPVRIRKHEASWLALDRWCEDNQRALPIRLTGTPPSYSLNASNGSLVLRSGTTSAFWSGSEVRLGFAPQFMDGHLYVHGLDLEKTIDPLINEWAPPSKTSRPVIVIDPGHGGGDPGTRAAATHSFEKDLTLDWALRLAPLLTANGWQVFLTRTNDSGLALSNRVAFADAHRADLFISLHFNSSAEGTQQGLETYCLTPAGMQSAITRGEDDLLASFPNNAFDSQNLALAYRVHAALLHTTATHDRGVRRARFPAVLRNQNRPAILVEGGYISNPEEAARIASPAHRQKLAEAIMRAICLEVPTVAARDTNPNDAN
jgi:N-acetylmuramoyl-L-alanine amidase